MHILVTNDDGVQAPGLMELAEAVKPFGEVSILAPEHNWSASGHVKTLHRDLRVKEVVIANGMTALATDGAPSDCVALGLLGLVHKPVDLVVSGINPSTNLGYDVTYSGTVTAAIEAVVWGVKGLAFSLDGPPHPGIEINYQTAAVVANKIVGSILSQDLPEKILLNVNIPNLPFDSIQGYKITRQGLRIYHDALIERKDSRQRPYYWIGGDGPTGLREDGTDIGELAKGFVSITPLHLDLTSYQSMEGMQNWFQFESTRLWKEMMRFLLYFNHQVTFY